MCVFSNFGRKYEITLSCLFEQCNVQSCVTYNPKKPSHRYLTGNFGSFEITLGVQQDAQFHKSHSE